MQKTTPIRTTSNRDVREREYLTLEEINELMAALKKKSRNPGRDTLLVLMMFRHGFRVSEVVSLKWDQVDFKGSRLQVNRLKGSKDSVHPIEGDELRLLRNLERKKESRHIFLSERKSPLTPQGVYRILKNVEQHLGWDFPIHPHMLRHACGYHLANNGTDTRVIQDYMGHSNIKNTVIYTSLSSNRFDNLWRA